MPREKVSKQLYLGLRYQNILTAKLAITHRAVTFSMFRYNRKTGRYIGAAKTAPPL